MSFTKVFISLFFLLLSASLFAEKPEKPDKILVCHVGSDKGSADQTYMENPNCDEPVDWDPEVEFRCPDAGKIDLILVSANSKHIDEDTEEGFHSYGGFSDYLPLGEAGEDAGDFEDGTNVDGIDKGCELEEEANLLCPCWSEYTRLELVNYINGWIEDDQSGSCNISELSISYSLGYDYDSTNKYDNHTIRSFNLGTKCQLSDKDLSFDLILDVTEPEHQQCFNEIFDLEPDIVICQNLP